MNVSHPSEKKRKKKAMLLATLVLHENLTMLGIHSFAVFNVIE